MEKKRKAGEALRQFISDYSVMEFLMFDGSKEQCKPKTEFMHQIKKHDVKYHISEPERPNQNPTEGVIRELQWKWFRVMVRKRVP